MRWSGGRSGGNIEDRRGMGPVGAVGGLGAGGVILALLGYFVFGIDPSTTLGVVNGGAQVEQQDGVRGQPADEAGRFVDVVATNVDDVWKSRVQGYRPPDAVVIYDRATGTGCGMGQSAMGPFYCPADRKVYLDLSFWQELEGKFGAGGEAARAYVIAHEIGHHVQNLTGASDRAQRMGARGEDSGSVRLELQADCYAGVWANYVKQQNYLESGDTEEAINAANAIGDDTLTRGQVSERNFTHGTSAQRMQWLKRGMQTGDVGQCDTFNTSI